MDYLIQKYTSITVEDLQKDLSIVYNAFIMFTVFFVFLLLMSVYRETIKKLTYFKNRKKLDLNKDNNQDFVFLYCCLVYRDSIFKWERNVEESSIWRNSYGTERCSFNWNKR